MAGMVATCTYRESGPIAAPSHRASYSNMRFIAQAPVPTALSHHQWRRCQGPTTAYISGTVVGPAHQTWSHFLNIPREARSNYDQIIYNGMGAGPRHQMIA